MNSTSQGIGVFDSGVGGLTVVRELRRILPQEKIVYFGDTARVPYGTKSKETIIRFSMENILFLLKQNVKLIVIACNTSSSLALPEIKKHFRIPIIGVILPGAKESVYATRNKRIGIIGTRATIASRAYEEEIKKLEPRAKIISQNCSLFVPLVEEGWLEGDIVNLVARHYLKPLKDFHVDTLILGCTHYPLLKKVIQGVMGKGVLLIDSSKQIAMEVKEILEEGTLLQKGKKSDGNNLYCYVTDKPKIFKSLGEKFLGEKLNNIREVNNV
ncbi:MAG: glutamate racemase [Candidatus Omnitrophica bacterium]|nr:glutamate racemase [Candidatus Omnitrophota bacterium]